MARPVLFRVTNNLNLGGVQRRLLALLPLLVPDFEVHVVTYRDRGLLFDELARAGVITHHLPIRSKWSPIGITKLAALFKRHRAEIVHTHSLGGNVSGILAAALARVPVRIGQVHVTGLHWYGRTVWRRRRQAFSEAMVHRFFSHAVLCVSAETRQTFLKGTGLPEAMVRTLYNGIDFDGMLKSEADSPRDLEREMGIEPGRSVIGVVGRMVRVKGIERVISLADFLKRERPGKFCVVLVGDGPLTEELKAEVKARGLEKVVFFAGEQKMLGPFYRFFDVLFFPSPAGSEGMSGVVLEACGAGLPVLANEAGFLDEIRPLYPWIHTFSPQSEPSDLAEGLARCLAMRPESMYPPLVDQFSIQAMRDRTVALYGTLLNARNPLSVEQSVKA